MKVKLSDYVGNLVIATQRDGSVLTGMLTDDGPSPYVYNLQGGHFGDNGDWDLYDATDADIVAISLLEPHQNTMKDLAISMGITPSPSSPLPAAEAIMAFVSQARSVSQASGFGERTFAAHVLLSAVEQVDLDESSREAFLAIADQLSDYRPLELAEQLRIRRQRRLEAQAARRCTPPAADG